MFSDSDRSWCGLWRHVPLDFFSPLSRFTRRDIPATYLSVVVNFCVSRTVSVLLRFECGPEVTWLPFRPLGDVIGKQRWRILKERPRFAIVINWNCLSSWHRFQVNSLSLLTGCDVIAIWPTYGYHRNLNFTYSESPYAILYLSVIVTFCVSRTASVLLSF